MPHTPKKNTSNGTRPVSVMLKVSTPRQSRGKNSPVNSQNSTVGKNTSAGSCPRHSAPFVRKSLSHASKDHTIKRILSLLVGALIMFSAVKLSGSFPSGGVSKECTVDTLGWFGRQGTRTARIYGMSKREVNKECVKLQKETSSRIESLRFWELNKTINSRKSIRTALDAILQSPLRVSENVLVSTVETSSILNKATRSASNLAQFIENVSVMIRDNTGTVLGVSLATVLLMLLIVEQQIMLPWVGFKNMVRQVASFIRRVPLTKMCQGVKYGMVEISSVFVHMLKKGKTVAASTNANANTTTTKNTSAKKNTTPTRRTSPRLSNRSKTRTRRRSVVA